MSNLADEESLILLKIRDILLIKYSFQEVNDPQLADILLIQEKQSFKNFRYIKDLMKDPWISKYANKVLTINNDDCATGLLRGLYTSIPKSRCTLGLHVSVPYMDFPNELVFQSPNKNDSPEFLAGWRGNPKSSSLRRRLFQDFQHNPNFCLETTKSWLNHSQKEKQDYVDLILNSKFSLCPTGWAPVSFRIYESMALGRCPVIIADDFVPPLGPEWNRFALFLPENKLKYLFDFLIENQENYELLGQWASEAWQKYFHAEARIDYYAQSIQDLLSANRFSSPKKEFERWNSLKLYWSNNWTIPQRAVNKIRRLALKVEE